MIAAYGLERLTDDNTFQRIYMAMRDMCSRNRHITMESLDINDFQHRGERLLGAIQVLAVERENAVFITAEDFSAAIARVEREYRREEVKKEKQSSSKGCVKKKRDGRGTTDPSWKGWYTTCPERTRDRLGLRKRETVGSRRPAS